MCNLTSYTHMSDKPIKHGKIKQGFAYWPCKDKWSPQVAIDKAKAKGCVGLELFPLAQTAELKAAGLTNTMVLVDYGDDGPPPFALGFGIRKHWKRVKNRTAQIAMACQVHGFKNVIAFTGYGRPTKATKATCVEGLKSMIPLLEQTGVTLCLEHLNNKDFGHPMKGHPGYMGHDIDFVCDVVKQVNHPKVRLLFDLYHVQVMHGEVLLHLEQCFPWIGHIHVAQTPGRAELDIPGGEIDFVAAMKFLVANGYDGFVGQEYVPAVGRDLDDGLDKSLAICDVP